MTRGAQSARHSRQLSEEDRGYLRRMIASMGSARTLWWFSTTPTTLDKVLGVGASPEVVARFEARIAEHRAAASEP